MTEHDQPRDDGTAADLGALVGRTVQAVEHAPGETYAVITLDHARLYVDDPSLYVDPAPRVDDTRRYLEGDTLDPACTGYVDEDGYLAHDGDTCPVHEVKTIGPGGSNAPATRYTEADTIPAARVTDEDDSELTRQQLAARSSATMQGDDTAGDPGHNRRADCPHTNTAPARCCNGVVCLDCGAHVSDVFTVELEGAEPTTLIEPALERGVTVTVKPSGTVGHDITLSGPRAAVLELIAEQWGEDDARTYGWAPPEDDDGPHGFVAILNEAADYAETLADIDDGEHMDADRARRVAARVRAYAAGAAQEPTE